MVQVLCTRPNAGEEISGVKFSLHKDAAGVPVGMISEEITVAQAENFLEVPGYELVQEEPKKAPDTAPAPKSVAPKQAAEKGSTKAEKAAAAAAVSLVAAAPADDAKNEEEKPLADTPPVDAPAADKPAADQEETF